VEGATGGTGRDSFTWRPFFTGRLGLGYSHREAPGGRSLNKTKNNVENWRKGGRDWWGDRWGRGVRILRMKGEGVWISIDVSTQKSEMSPLDILRVRGDSANSVLEVSGKASRGEEVNLEKKKKGGGPRNNMRSSRKENV